MRLNNSIQCKTIDSSEFPSTCAGTRPFTATFSADDLVDPSPGGSSVLSSRICVPGDYSKVPWSLSRDRQDISEDIYFEVQSGSRFAMHCTSNTTRGYFELGNYQNDFDYQPLLTSWPSEEVRAVDFNDYLAWTSPIESPSTINTDPFLETSGTQTDLWQTPFDPLNSETLLTPGPLMTSAIALFGNYSFFNYTSTLVSSNILTSNASTAATRSALYQICQPNVFPFQRYNSTLFSHVTLNVPNCNTIFSNLAGDSIGQASNQAYVLAMLNTFLSLFTTDPATTETVLSASVFYANQAYLTQTANANQDDHGDGTPTSRSIYTSTGTTFTKPSKSLASTIVISVLLGLQLLSLAFLVLYIYSIPTWNTSLDTLAVARLVAGMQKEDLGALGEETEGQLRQLRDVDGLVGVGENGAVGLGQMGLVRRKMGKEMEKEKVIDQRGREQESSLSLL